MSQRSFFIYPAIDMRHGKVVRLVQGDPQRQTVFGDDPAQSAKKWIDAGASWLHVVNLDGAFGDGGQENLAALRGILQAAAAASQPVSVQWGGGVRTTEDVRTLLEAGVSRVILGSAAVETPEVLTQALAEFGAQKVALAIDVREGKLRVRGWQQAVADDPVSVGVKFFELGLRTCIYTDIQRDGGGQGLNLAATAQFSQATGLQVIASGGVAVLEDVASVARAGLSGVIIGRALYDGNIELADALAYQTF